METKRGGRPLGVLIAAFAVAATAACATTASSPRAVDDVLGIAGRWVGTCDFGSGQQPCNVLIGQSGTFTATAGSSSVFGTVRAVGGRGVFDVGTASGDIALYEGGTCRRQIVVTGSKGVAKGQLSQDGAAARRVTDLSSVAGRWSGTCDLGAGMLPCTVNIGQDGSFAGTAGTSSATGRVAVMDGKAVFDTGTAAGDIVLHDGAGCQRQIAVVGSKGVARGYLTPQP